MLNFFNSDSENPYLAKPPVTSYLIDDMYGGVPDLILTTGSSRPSRYPIRLIAIGIPDGVNAVVNELHARKFAEVHGWSRSLKTHYPGEIMRIMTRYFIMNS